MIELNKIYCESNMDTMARMPDSFISLTVTSPPYDNLRAYNNYAWDCGEVASELFRVTKDGGAVVWVVGDATVDGCETGSSFRQALMFMDIGFRLHDTMIYEKNSSAFPASKESNRYTQIFEYMFVFSKEKPLYGQLLCDKQNKWAGFTNWGNNTQYDAEGHKVQTNNIKPVPAFSLRNNIWRYTVGFNDATDHPAVFPEELARDHILSWSNETDIVYDPFMGSGTTAKMAHLLRRNWIGSEISSEYVDLANKRLEPYLAQSSLF